VTHVREKVHRIESILGTLPIKVSSIFFDWSCQYTIEAWRFDVFNQGIVDHHKIQQSKYNKYGRWFGFQPRYNGVGI